MKPATHCQLGHEFTVENTIPRSDGKRMCRICHYARVAAFRKTPKGLAVADRAIAKYRSTDAGKKVYRRSSLKSYHTSRLKRANDVIVDPLSTPEQQTKARAMAKTAKKYLKLLNTKP